MVQHSVVWLQELMERAVVLTQGGGQPQASPALGDLIAQYSSILASQVPGYYLAYTLTITTRLLLCVQAYTCITGAKYS